MESAYEQKYGGLGFAMFRFSDTKEQFEQNYAEAIEKRGIVREDLENLRFPILNLDLVENMDNDKVIEFAEKKRIFGNKTIIIGNTVGSLYINKRVFSKSLSNKAVGKSYSRRHQITILLNLEFVINSSIDIEIHADCLKKNDVRAIENGYNKSILIHRLYAAVNIGNDIYRVKTTIKEYKDETIMSRPYTFEITKVELVLESGQSQYGQNPPMKLANSISATKLLKNIEKTYDKGVFLIKNQNNTDLGNASFRFEYDDKARRLHLAKLKVKVAKARLELMKIDGGIANNVTSNDSPNIRKYLQMALDEIQEIKKKPYFVDKIIEAKIGNNKLMIYSRGVLIGHLQITQDGDDTIIKVSDTVNETNGVHYDHRFPISQYTINYRVRCVLSAIRQQGDQYSQYANQMADIVRRLSETEEHKDKRLIARVSDGKFADRKAKVVLVQGRVKTTSKVLAIVRICPRTPNLHCPEDYSVFYDIKNSTMSGGSTGFDSTTDNVQDFFEKIVNTIIKGIYGND